MQAKLANSFSMAGLMRLKIGVFCPTLNIFGGAEFVAVVIANTLAENNHDVVLFANSDIYSQEVKNYCGVFLHPSIQTIKQPTNFSSRGLADFYQTLFHSYIAKSRCDIFIDPFTNCIFPWTSICYIHFPFLNRYSFSKRFPYLSSPHLLPIGAIPHVLIEKNLATYENKLVLANSRYTAEEVKLYSQKRVGVLYPPFSSSISAIGKEAKKDLEENLVVTTSRFDNDKLLERIPHIASQTRSSTQFAIIGRLCSKKTLISLEKIVKKLGLTERVKFFPDASNEVKIDLLRRAKVYLHTMMGEHFGISIVEAMALGCLPIVHNSGGMREFVPDSYRYETIQEAVIRIDSALSSWTPDKSEEMKQIAGNFSMSNFAANFMSFFKEYFE